jgi:hypothetical protein
MKCALVIAAAIVFSANAAQAQQCPIAQHCMICAARGVQALYRAGDPRQELSPNLGDGKGQAAAS